MTPRPLNNWDIYINPKTHGYFTPLWYNHRDVHQYDPSAAYLNGLAQTCRLAYYDSSHLLFQTHAFHFRSGSLLRKFISGSMPIHLQSIHELTVLSLTQSSLAAALGLECARCLKPCDLKVLKPFPGLRILHLKDNSYRERYKYGAGKYSRKLMTALARASNAHNLESLQTVILTSVDYDHHRLKYAQLNLDFDDISGWVYSFSAEAVPHCIISIVFTEVL